MKSSFTTRARKTRNARRTRGAAMVETVVVLPFVMVMIVLIIYLGWNFRRLAQVTNIDRYTVWESATPGSPGPGTQGLPQTIRNPQMNHAFFGLNGDEGVKLDELRPNTGYPIKGHDDLRDRQADETFSYFDEFLERNPEGIQQQYKARHEQITQSLENMGMADMTGNVQGHYRMNGEWRYANGIRQNDGKWIPAGYRVSPGSSMREVFFVEMDDGLEPYASRGNKLARAIREFYLSYPGYIGPDVNDRAWTGSGTNPNSGGPASGF